jgi:hypothetical protein
MHFQFRLPVCILAGAVALSTLGICDFAVAVPPRIKAGRLRVGLTRVVDRPVSTNLSNPTIGLSFAPGDTQRMFFVEKGGFSPGSNTARIQMLNLNSGTYSTFLDLRAAGLPTLNNSNENGFLGMAFHPGFANSESPGYRKLYTYNSVVTDAGATVDFTSQYPTSHHNIITEWQVDANNPNIVDMTTRREVFREAHPGNPEHNAGTLAFDANGYLYGGIGTPTQSTQQLLSAQDNSDILGTIFRIDPLDPASTPASTNPASANGKYRIPADNPFVNDPAALDEIYAYGFRNPYRFSIDQVSGQLFVGDVGQGVTEEIDAVVPGGNYGWPYRQGSSDSGGVSMPMPAPTLQSPITEYSHGDGKAIIGGYVYRGPVEALQGKYIFGDFTNHPAFFGAGARGDLFISDVFDAEGNLKSPANVSTTQILVDPATCAQNLNAGCTFDTVMFAFATDSNGNLYTVSSGGNRAVVYKFTSAYYLPEGDYNEDGTVDARDYNVWRDAMDSSTLYQPAPSTLTEGYGHKADGDGDGVIDMDDYNIWKAHFGESINLGAGGMALAVPELSSATLALIAIGAASIVTKRRRNRK